MKPEQLLTMMQDRDGDDMWKASAVRLLETLRGTDIDPTKADIDVLSEIEDLRGRNPQVMSFLTTLPGYPTNRTKALDHLSYLTMQYRRCAAMMP